MADIIPSVNKLLAPDKPTIIFPLVQAEENMIHTATRLLEDGYAPQCLTELWNASLHNLRRRVEAYGVELFLSTVRGESGRKSYKEDGETLAHRWSAVDATVVISGAKNLGLLSAKAAKCIETVNWMRNHASSAHESDHQVSDIEVRSLAVLLGASLFSVPLPNPGYSVATLFEPAKNSTLNEAQLSSFRDQINAYNQSDVRNCFGFLLDILCSMQEPGVRNATFLFPAVWERATEDVRKIAGLRYHNLAIGGDSEVADAKEALLNVLVTQKGVKYIPDGTRITLYRGLAQRLATAKNTSYGWMQENAVARTLAQFGVNVPDVVFEELYQEILAVWCGNYWGNSGSGSYLRPFIFDLPPEKQREIVRMFKSNERVCEEMIVSKPNARAVSLLNEIKEGLTFETNKQEVDEVIRLLKQLV